MTTLQDKKRRLRELGLPPMTAADEQAFTRNLTDTAAVDARMSQIGSTKTTMKGAKIVNGDYKGLTPAQAQQAAMTGTMPKGLQRPGAMGRMSGSLTGDSLPQTAPSAAPTLPTGGRMMPGRSTGSQVYVPPVSAAPTAPNPTAAPAGQPRITQSLLNVPSTGSQRPPLQAASNPTAAPRAPGLINGQPAPQFFQETANRQGTPNSYGTIKPQAPAPAPVAPAPAGGATMMAGPPAIGALPDLSQGPPKAARLLNGAAPPTPPAAATPNGPRLSFGAPKFMPDKPFDSSPIADTMKNNQMIRPGFDKIIAGAQFPVPTAAMPPPPAAPAVAAPRIAPFGGPPKMLTSTANTRPAKTLQPPQLSMSR